MKDCSKNAWEKPKRKTDRDSLRRGAVVSKMGKKRCFDWQLSGLVPAEVVPPADCYYQQKDFPIALAATVSPLSPGGCYPIWEEMNRGPFTLYEVSVLRIFTDGAQWSKQTLCQQPHPWHFLKITSVLSTQVFSAKTLSKLIYLCDRKAVHWSLPTFLSLLLLLFFFTW